MNGSIAGHVRSSAERHDAEEDAGEHARAADAVGEPAADRAQERGEHDEPGGAEPGVGGRKAERVLQERRQVDRERDESAEGQEVEEREDPGEPLTAEDREHFRDPRAPPGPGSVPGQKSEHHRPEEQQHGEPAKDRGKPDPGAERGPQKHGGGLADRPQPVESQRGALTLGRRPP